jgi:hypothetical protein
MPPFGGRPLTVFALQTILSLKGRGNKRKTTTAFKYPVGFADYPFSTKRGIKTKARGKRH